MATYYVATTGSDGAAGSSGAPWATIGHAASTMVAGDTCIVKDGTYTEAMISFNTSGTAGNPITLIAEHQWLAILASTSNTTTTSHPSISINASYVTIENMRFQDAAGANTPSDLNSASAYIRAWEQTDPLINVVAGTGYTNSIVRGCSFDASDARYLAVKSNQDYSVIANCTSSSCLEVFNGREQVISGCTINDCGPTAGVYIVCKGGLRDAQVYNNVVHQGRAGTIGILLGGVTGSTFFYDPSTAIEIYNGAAYNNIVFQESSDSHNTPFAWWGAVDSVFCNNIAIANGTGGTGIAGNTGGLSNTSVRHKTTNCSAYNNIWVKGGYADFCPGRDGDINDPASCTGLTFNNNNVGAWVSDVPTGSNNITSDPLFVNAASDWRLQAGSPSIDAGVTVSAPKYHGGTHSLAVDVVGVSRPKGSAWDLGIYEAVTSTSRYLPRVWA